MSFSPFHPNIAQVTQELFFFPRPANPRVQAARLLTPLLKECRLKGPRPVCVYLLQREERGYMSQPADHEHSCNPPRPSARPPFQPAACWVQRFGCPVRTRRAVISLPLIRGKSLGPASWIIGNIRKAISKAHGRRRFNEVRVTVATARWWKEWRRGRRRWGGSV